MTQEKRKRKYKEDLLSQERIDVEARDVMGHVSISIRRIATVVVADNLCVFPPDKSILDGRRRPPCRTKLIRKWRSLGEPLFRVDCTPPNGNGLLPPFSNLCTSICSFSFPWVNRHTHAHTHTHGGRTTK